MKRATEHMLLEQPVKNAGHCKRRMALAMAGILAVMPTAEAGLPDMTAFNDMHEISDADLGHMRGKFASNNQVMYFGVEMVSQWQTPAGSMVTAGANLNIDFRNSNGTPAVQYAPTVTIVQGQGGQPNPGNNTTSVGGGAGLANVSGVSQSIQVAGQTNHIRNDIGMQVDMFAAMQGGGSIADAAQGKAGTVSATGGDGTVATVTLANNNIGVSVTVPGQGQVLQQIQNSGMLQAARIGGDLNRIHNQITMQIGLNSATGLGSAGTAAALQGLKGMPQTGMF